MNNRSLWIQRFTSVIILANLLTGCHSSSSEGIRNQTEKDVIPISVDPRVELFSTIHRLAGTGQYDERLLPDYISDVENHFGSFRNHPAVRLAKEQNVSEGINGNAPMSLAVYLTDPPELEGRVPLNPPPGRLDRRWSGEAISSILQAARAFAGDTNFDGFFNEHLPLYDRAVKNLRTAMEGTDLLPWFRAYFGYLPDNFVIIIGMQNGRSNYGSRVTLAEGRTEFQSLLGAARPDKYGAPRYRRGAIAIIVHEFCHAYVNPIINRHVEKFRAAGEALYPSHEAHMRQWGYNVWYVMIQEYLVRACTIRYLHANGNTRAARQNALRDERVGFPAIHGLARLLESYENQRDTYPDMESFIHRVIDYFEDCAGAANVRRSKG